MEDSHSVISVSSETSSTANLTIRKWLLHILGTYWRPLILILTPLAALSLPLVSGLDRDWCAFMMILMGVYWVFELLPLAVTSLIPVVLCPLLGLLSTNDVSMQYMKGTNMLFIGGGFGEEDISRHTRQETATLVRELAAAGTTTIVTAALNTLH